MEDIRVQSWNELNERLYEGSWEEPLARFRSNLAFRGLGNSSYDLKTGLIRLGGAAEKLEGHLLRNYRKYARRDAVPDDSMWNCRDALRDGPPAGLRLRWRDLVR